AIQGGPDSWRAGSWRFLGSPCGDFHHRPLYGDCGCRRRRQRQRVGNVRCDDFLYEVDEDLDMEWLDDHAGYWERGKIAKENSEINVCLGSKRKSSAKGENGGCSSTR